MSRFIVGKPRQAARISPLIKFQFFPRSVGLTPSIKAIVECFRNVEAEISSDIHNYVSNDVLAILRPQFQAIGLDVEMGKKSVEKIHVPVLFGKNNTIEKYFYADALSEDGTIVVEIEAGRATENYQFLKDIFQACMMYGVEYLVLAVRNTYRNHNDFELIYSFLETLYISSRLTLPLKGILLVGY